MGTRGAPRGVESDAAEQARRPFVLAPFRGLRFDAERVGDLGTVISPPYDVLDADTVRELEAANHRNIVRLILSRRFERPYQAVRRRLQKWRDQKYLCADQRPALYLYQYTVDQVTVRGLVGLVALRDEHEGVILPHEDVMAAPVEDRMVLMRTTETNLEPILLVHQGTPGLRELLTETARTEPLADFAALDGTRHTLWSVTDPGLLDSVAGELTGAQALIADGHHRYAAYLGLLEEAGGIPVAGDSAEGDPAEAGDSPWAYGLAMLVDQHDYPMTIGPIHRSVAALTVADVQDLCAEHGDEFSTYPDREAAFAAATRDGDEQGTAAFVLSDGRSWAVVSTPRTHEVDAAVLHTTLFEAWQIAEEQVGYHHSLDQALQMTTRQPGVVVAVQPPSVAQVMETAARGERMPRKSTSFAPKPRMGLVMRDLRDR